MNYKSRLELFLIPHKDGYSYEWQDGHGKCWCSGWAEGTKAQVKLQAEAHLNGKMPYNEIR